MRLTKKQLTVIIENYLHESKSVSEKEIKQSFESVIKEIKGEIQNNNKDRLSPVVIKSVSNVMNRVKLYIVPTGDPIYDNPEVSNYEGFALHIKFDSEGNPKPEQLNMNIIKDKALQSAYEKNAVTSPIVVIFQKNVKSEEELKRLMFHEVGHIKNNFIKMYEGVSLNVEDVRNILRKDLKGLSVKEMIKVFKDEGRLSKFTLPGMSTLIAKYKEYYDGVFSEPPVELSVDEFAVRISGLQRQIVAQSSLSKGERQEFSKIKKKYGVDTAGLSLFLKDDFEKSEVDAIVKSTEGENKNSKNV